MSPQTIQCNIKKINVFYIRRNKERLKQVENSENVIASLNFFFADGRKYSAKRTKKLKLYLFSFLIVSFKGTEIILKNSTTPYQAFS